MPSDDEIKDTLLFISKNGPPMGLREFFESIGPGYMIRGTVWPDGTHTSELIECPVRTAKSAESASPQETSVKIALKPSTEPIPSPSKNT